MKSSKSSKSWTHTFRSWLGQPRTPVRLCCAIAWGAVLLLFLPTASAQTTSSISGTVRDTSDALVPGASVTLINEASKATRTATSNGEGYFDFSAVQPATYSIEVKMKNFKSWKVTGVEAHPGDSITVPKISLVIGQVVQEVTVSAEVAGVTLSSPEHSTLITAEDINRLSTVGRDALELVNILPGFTLNAGTNVQNQGPDYTTTGFGSANVGSFGANGAAPQQGLVNITSDGAQVIDPGDMGATVANINMDQVQEVKVQTSNFGADEAKGPIVINAVGKSGGSEYHGSLSMYARDAALNSNDWLSNYAGAAKTQSKYIYPGGTVGGPVKIPGTHFNHNKRLTFWTGFEYYGQTNNANGGPLFGFIPTPSMLGKASSTPGGGGIGTYDFSPASLGAALNVDPTALANGCASYFAPTAAFTNVGGDCASPAGGVDQNGLSVPPVGSKNAGFLNSINPAVATYTSLYPAINRVPQPSNGYASDGYNYVANVLATHNGFQLHSRVDENFSDSLKLYGVFNWEKVNDESPLNNIYYNPSDTIPFPTPLFSNGYSDYGSLNLTKVINNSMTNELIGAGVYFDQPEQFADRSKALDTGTPWATAGYEGGALKTGVNQLPRIYSFETVGVPNFSFGNVPAGSQYLRKSSWDITDNFTKVYRTHTFKVGAYLEQTRNNQVTLGSDANGTITFDRYESCLPNEQKPDMNSATGAIMIPPGSGLKNTTANFLAGCAGGYSQSAADPSIDMYFDTLEFYATDEWKLTPKLTLTAGIRFSHLPPWTDSHGIGAAVFDPTRYNPIQVGVIDESMPADVSLWPGISWHKINASIPVAGVGSRALFYSPRVGIAYDMYGNGKTVLRGGWGAYRSRDSYNVVSAALGTSINLVDHAITGNDGCTLDQLFNGVPNPTLATGTQVLGCGWYQGGPVNFTSASSLVSQGTVAVNAVDPKDNEQPVTYNYNFTLDQQLPFGSTLEVAYIGNQSTNLATLGSLQNQDVVPLGAFFGPDPAANSPNHGQTIAASTIVGNGSLEAQYRPYPNYTAINIPHHTNWANYNAMQVSLNKQRGSLVVGINYTWSKAMGVRGNFDTGYIGDPVNAQHDYGVVSFDRPQVINFNYSYQEGKKFRGNRVLGWFLNTWEMSGATSLQSGPDLAILNGSTNFGMSATAGYYAGATQVVVPVTGATWLGSSDYTLQPTVTCDPRANLRSKILSGSLPSKEYANGNCFSLPTQGTQGWWNLPDVHGPAFFKSDLSIYKDILINDRQNLQFRMAGFNFLNHPISSFSNNNLAALGLNFVDSNAACNTLTGAGCYTSQSQAFAGLVESNPGFGYTPFKYGVRIVEFGVKYNF